MWLIRLERKDLLVTHRSWRDQIPLLGQDLAVYYGSLSCVSKGLKGWVVWEFLAAEMCRMCAVWDWMESASIHVARLRAAMMLPRALVLAIFAYAHHISSHGVEMNWQSRRFHLPTKHLTQRPCDSDILWHRRLPLPGWALVPRNWKRDIFDQRLLKESSCACLHESSWWVFMMRLHDESSWWVFMMSLHDESSWWVFMMSLHDESSWFFNVL